MRNLFNRVRWWMLTLSTGAGVMVLAGCDPNARDTVLGGVQDASIGLLTTFVTAFFETLSASDNTNGVSTVQVLVDNAAKLFC